MHIESHIVKELWLFYLDCSSFMAFVNFLRLNIIGHKNVQSR